MRSAAAGRIQSDSCSGISGEAGRLKRSRTICGASCFFLPPPYGGTILRRTFTLGNETPFHRFTILFSPGAKGKRFPNTIYTHVRCKFFTLISERKTQKVTIPGKTSG